MAVASTPLTTTRPTNTLVLASLPLSFFHPVILNAFRDHFATYGELHTFAPIRAFRRVIIVYYDDYAAERGKMSLDGVEMGGFEGHPRVTLRVYRGDPTPLEPPSPSSDSSQTRDPNYLAPPSHTKNFLISPPGSPPVGWEPVKEDPPNATPLADDLIVALRRLQHEQEIRENYRRRSEDGRAEVLFHPEETPAGIGVYVEDCGQPEDSFIEEPEWSYGAEQQQKPKYSLPRTAMPPAISR